ncbi:MULTISPECIES: hypothetical protein [Helicobacter]|uniref:Uncharacterized protein n=2 Tax=Helicobacter TaxID=209 RepID=A0A377JNB9_9HELI|nr:MULTISPECIES: hypothetical protein [Helicobacter]KAA8708171.1 hypothetical protein F4V45_06950 [Helicobacter canis]MDL0080969.1 hypothetical protein [Helicobacter sp. CPD2-1]MDL0082964.1 hypothetical protein [Helicobacter sp. XJK30-2]STP06498.1 Uncharacterised protein [Helicobacter canis]
MIEIDNFREITKKDKVYLPKTNIGLSRNMLLLALLLGGGLYLFVVWWAIPIFFLILIVFLICEYFDEDMYDIFLINTKFKTRRRFYA